ncbi:MAG: hypothetical protein IJN00_06370, partial [Clostridia bacterium]|nr:hypothetical protein [Clostridia bacterium]
MNTHAKHISVIILIIMVFLLRFSSSATAGAASGVALFLNSVLPALLPFFVCSCILIRLGTIQAVSKALSAFMRPFFSLGGESMPAFVIGAVSGYPNGARVTAELYSQNHLPAHDAGRTYLLSSLASPSFILSAVAASMLKKPGCGWVLMLSHLLSAVTVYRFWPQDRSCIDARVKTQAPQAQTQRPLRICLD